MGRGRYNRPEDQQVLEALRKVAAQRGEAPAQVAIAWLLSKPAVTAPIIGVTKPHHMDDPLKAVERPLSEAEIAALEAPYAPQAVIGALGPADAAARQALVEAPRPRPVAA
jgi:aryl-alcohol dehydrogenase-like predicted oxidoreductase